MHKPDEVEQQNAQADAMDDEAVAQVTQAAQGDDSNSFVFVYRLRVRDQFVAAAAASSSSAAAMSSSAAASSSSRTDEEARFFSLPDAAAVTKAKADGTIYNPRVGQHSWGSNLQWCVDAINAGKEVRIKSPIHAASFTRDGIGFEGAMANKNVSHLSAFTREIGTFTKLGYQVAIEEGYIKLTPSPEGTPPGVSTPDPSFDECVAGTEKVLDAIITCLNNKAIESGVQCYIDLIESNPAFCEPNIRKTQPLTRTRTDFDPSEDGELKIADYSRLFFAMTKDGDGLYDADFTEKMCVISHLVDRGLVYQATNGEMDKALFEPVSVAADDDEESAAVAQVRTAAAVKKAGNVNDGDDEDNDDGDDDGMTRQLS